METLIFALIASYNAHRQQEPVVAESEEFQPFDLQGAEKLRGQQTEPVVESTGGIRATNRLTSSTMDPKANLYSPQTPFFKPARGSCKSASLITGIVGQAIAGQPEYFSFQETGMI
jgi:hypothetical protein